MYSPDPVHIVAVQKTGSWGRPMQFEFMVDDSPAVETAHFVP
jgi:hypothetical protein